MTPICTVQMPSDEKKTGRLSNGQGVHPDGGSKSSFHRLAFTVIELVIVLVIVSMFVLIAVINLSGSLRRNTFKGQMQEFISTMQMAARAAAETERRYEVIIDLTEQIYILREVTSPDLEQVLQEEIIVENDFGDKCEAVYVIFDDLVSTNENFDIATFRAGRRGWQNGGKIVLIDQDQQLYSVVVNRLNRTVVLKEGDVEILLPKRQDEIFF
jgi:type II secretory pathway pseudopilin PulG